MNKDELKAKIADLKAKVFQPGQPVNTTLYQDLKEAEQSLSAIEMRGRMARRPLTTAQRRKDLAPRKLQRPNAMCETKIYGASGKSAVKSGNERSTITAGARFDFPVTDH
jgi:hypothetical protein